MRVLKRPTAPRIVLFIFGFSSFLFPNEAMAAAAAVAKEKQELEEIGKAKAALESAQQNDLALLKAHLERHSFVPTLIPSMQWYLGE